MKNQKEFEQKIKQLQILEYNLQNFLMQKQNLQVQLLEIENALKELETVKEEPYKIVGNIMVKSDKAKLIKELNSKEEVIELRLKAIDKQEAELRNKASELQQTVLKDMD
ncbi:prefoldin subunit beta [Candidatus Woesearchaeota archaeon]|nr:prefoldin subunit beta [Candidatus Woesearchaeota archaeon]